MQFKGNLLKMKVSLDQQNRAQYSLNLSDQSISLNDCVGKKLRLEHTGNIYCIHSGQKIKKSYQQGYSYEATLKLAACDLCIVKPELCHYHMGTCREPLWAQKHCFQPHYLYLAITSSVKIGLTRSEQIPTRWIDQGAQQAILLAKVSSRRAAGLIEVQLAKEVSDKTNWTKMLKGEIDGEYDLTQLRDKFQEKHAELFEKFSAEMITEPLQNIVYPGEYQLAKVSSYNFDKDCLIEDTLLGIKGQYLIFEQGVINIRKFQGYQVCLQFIK